MKPLGLLPLPPEKSSTYVASTRIEHGHRLPLLGERQHISKAQTLSVEAQAPVEVGCLDRDVMEPAAP